MKKTLLIGAAVASVTAFADLSSGIFYEDSFTGTTTADGATWSGDYTFTESSGYLTVDGTATCTTNATEDTTHTCRVVKFTLTAEAAGSDPTADDTVDSDVQIGIATGALSDGSVPFYVYSNSTWTATGITATDGAAVEVVLTFTYGDTDTCDVTIGGTSAGTITLATTDPATVASVAFEGATTLSYIYLADTGTTLSGVTVGDGTGDDASLDNLTIVYDDLIKFGIDTTSGTSISADQATALVTGIYTNGTDAAVDFSATSMTVTESDGSQTAAVTVPCDVDNGQIYQVVFTYTTDGTTTTTVTNSAEKGTITDGSRSLSFSFPSNTGAKVLKFKIHATNPGSTN